MITPFEKPAYGLPSQVPPPIPRESASDLIALPKSSSTKQIFEKAASLISPKGA